MKMKTVTMGLTALAMLGTASVFADVPTPPTPTSLTPSLQDVATAVMQRDQSTARVKYNGYYYHFGEQSNGNCPMHILDKMTSLPAKYLTFVHHSSGPSGYVLDGSKGAITDGSHRAYFGTGYLNAIARDRHGDPDPELGTVKVCFKYVSSAATNAPSID